MVFVYILKSLKDNGFYVGISKDIDSRLIKHNRGSVSSTSKRRPFQLIYNESFANYSSARLREKEIKSYKGGLKFKELIK